MSLDIHIAYRALRKVEVELFLLKSKDYMDSSSKTNDKPGLLYLILEDKGVKLLLEFINTDRVTHKFPPISPIHLKTHWENNLKNLIKFYLNLLDQYKLIKSEHFIEKLLISQNEIEKKFNQKIKQFEEKASLFLLELNNFKLVLISGAIKRSINLDSELKIQTKKINNFFSE